MNSGPLGKKDEENKTLEQVCMQKDPEAFMKMKKEIEERTPLSQEITSRDIQDLVDKLGKLLTLSIDQLVTMRQLVALLMPKNTISFHMDIPGLPGKLGDRSPTQTELQCYLLGIQQTITASDISSEIGDDNVRGLFAELGIPSIDCHKCDETAIFSLCQNIKGKWYCESCAASVMVTTK